MLTTSRISTDGLPAFRRVSLIRDTADRLFNVDADLREVEPHSANADIQASRRGEIGLVRVRTTASTVTRSPARARAAASGNLLLYVIDQGGSAIDNGRGGRFTTGAGSIFIGSQDVAYAARSAPGSDWNFRTLSIPEQLLPASRTRVRQQGFQQVVAATPMFRLLSSHLGALFAEFPVLDADATGASLRALDALLAAALGERVAPSHDMLNAIAMSRRRAALAYMRAELAAPSLAPATVARYLQLSPRQLHRCFEGSGATVSGELRRLRVERASELITADPRSSVTEVAMSCGFDSLATFYRAFRACFGMTASEWRDSGPGTGESA